MIQWELFYETCHKNANKLKQLKKENDRVKIKDRFITETESSSSSSDEASEDEFTDDFLALYVRHRNKKRHNDFFLFLGRRS